MTETLWLLFFLQVAMGAFDTIYHHEITERLAWRASQRDELWLHGARNLIYALIFAMLGWSEPRGAAALLLIGLMLAELILTLWDFVVEDRTRALPASERITHTLLTLNYGVFLALLVPILVAWSALPTALTPVSHGWLSWLCLPATFGVALAGLRDLAAAWRSARLIESDPASLAAALPGRQSILVTGGTGLIGTRLVSALVGAGHDVTVLTRRRAKAAALPTPLRIVTSLEQIAGDARIDAIVNLAGEPISDGLWTRAKKRRILRSRLITTRAVRQLIARLETRPSVLVSGSAIGWYGLRGDEMLDEGTDGRPCFSRALCRRWESTALKARDHGTRVVTLRTGLVLSTQGGLLARLLTPFEFGLGGPMGDGRQWMSWIHVDDLVRLIVHCLATPALNGPINGTAPEPARNADLSAALGHALRRPALLPMPAAPLRLLLGAFADELLLGGQRVLPQAAEASGFRFAYPRIEDALAAILGRSRRAPRPVLKTGPLWR